MNNEFKLDVELGPKAASLPRVAFTPARAANPADAARPDVIFGVTSVDKLLKEVSYRLSLTKTPPP